MAKKTVSLRASDKSKKGGLTASGRKRINKATGSNLKAPVTKKQAAKSPAKAKRRKSYCARSKGQQEMHAIDCRKTPKKRICKARRRWDCD
jgi:hypothetical protein